MSQNQIGFIGAGNMGGALLAGIQAKKPEMSTAAYDILPAACEKAKKLGATVYASIEELVQESEMIVIAVKPQYFGDVFPHIREALRERKKIISITPGFVFNISTKNWETMRFSHERFPICRPWSEQVSH